MCVLQLQVRTMKLQFRTDCICIMPRACRMRTCDLTMCLQVSDLECEFESVELRKDYAHCSTPQACTVAVNKKFTFRLQTTIVLRSVPLLRNLPVLRLLSQQLSPSRVSGQVRRLLSPVTSKLQTRDKRQRIVKAFQ